MSKLFEEVLGIAGSTEQPYGALSSKRIKYVASAPSDKNPKSPIGSHLKKEAINMPDTHNQPGTRPLEKYDAYGRWWWDGQQIRANGGPMGSSTGHPSNAEIAGYWGVESFNEGKFPAGAVLIRGRMLSDEEEKFIIEDEYRDDILQAIKGLIPKIK